MTLNTNTFEQLPALPVIDWNKLKHFYYIAKLGSFTHAANFINSTQPCLSRQIGLLEKSLDCRLFTRSYCGVELTRKGQELLDIVEQHYLHLKGFVYNHKVINNENGKRIIRIVTTHAFAAYILDEYLNNYNLSNPDIIYDIITDDQIVDLTIHDVDIAIKTFDHNAVGVFQEHVFTFEKKLFASQSYVSKYGAPSDIYDLVNHHVIAHSQRQKYPHSNLDWILRLGMPGGKLRKPVLTTNSLENAVSAAKNGIGIIASYEEMSIIKEANLVKILPYSTGPSLKVYLIFPDYLLSDEQFTKFREFLTISLNNHREVY